MSLVFHFLVALALHANGFTSHALEAATPGSHHAGSEAAISTDAAQCEVSAGEALDGSAVEAAAGLRQGYCLDDCSPCYTREDCASPQFPHGITCTSIPLC